MMIYCYDKEYVDNLKTQLELSENRYKLALDKCEELEAEKDTQIERLKHLVLEREAERDKLKELHEIPMEILSNLIYWETCPDDYKDKCEKFIKHFTPTPTIYNASPEELDEFHEWKKNGKHFTPKEGN